MHPLQILWPQRVVIMLCESVLEHAMQREYVCWVCLQDGQVRPGLFRFAITYRLQQALWK